MYEEKEHLVSQIVGEIAKDCLKRGDTERGFKYESLRRDFAGKFPFLKDLTDDEIRQLFVNFSHDTKILSTISHYIEANKYLYPEENEEGRGLTVEINQEFLYLNEEDFKNNSFLYPTEELFELWAIEETLEGLSEDSLMNFIAKQDDINLKYLAYKRL